MDGEMKFWLWVIVLVGLFLGGAKALSIAERAVAPCICPESVK